MRAVILAGLVLIAVYGWRLWDGHRVAHQQFMVLCHQAQEQFRQRHVHDPPPRPVIIGPLPEQESMPDCD